MWDRVQGFGSEIGLNLRGLVVLRPLRESGIVPQKSGEQCPLEDRRAGNQTKMRERLDNFGEAEMLMRQMAFDRTSLRMSYSQDEIMFLGTS